MRQHGFIPAASALLSLLMTGLMAGSSGAAVRIDNDQGGPLGDYILQFTKLNRSGERVIIDGRCFSACTTVIGLMPRNKTCVTPRAVLGFHAAMARNALGAMAVDLDATRLIFSLYPRRVRQWINANGGLGPRMIYLSGAELNRLVTPCS